MPEERCSAYLASTIDKIVLIKHVHGLAFPQAAGLHDADFPTRLHFPACLLNHGGPVAHVAAQSNEDMFVFQRLGTAA